MFFQKICNLDIDMPHSKHDILNRKHQYNVTSWYCVWRTNEFLQLHFHYFISKRQHCYSTNIKNYKMCYINHIYSTLLTSIQNYCGAGVNNSQSGLYTRPYLDPPLISWRIFLGPFPVFLYASREIGPF